MAAGTGRAPAGQAVLAPETHQDPAAATDDLVTHPWEPEGRHAEVSADDGPYARMLPGIRGVRLQLLRVEATFKYDDHKPVEHRERVLDHLVRRDHGLDPGAAAQQRRRLDTIGDWQDQLD